MFFPASAATRSGCSSLLALVFGVGLRRVRRRGRRHRHRRHLERLRWRWPIRLEGPAEGLRQPEGRAGFPGMHLATAQQTKGDTDGAIQSLQSYAALRPRGGVRCASWPASTSPRRMPLQNRLQILQYRAAYLAPGTVRSTIFGLERDASRRRPHHGGRELQLPAGHLGRSDRAPTSRAQAVDAYKRITQIRPKDPSRPARARPGSLLRRRRGDDNRRVELVASAWHHGPPRRPKCAGS